MAAAGLTALAPVADVVTDGRIEPMELLSDPAELTGAAWYLGALSTLNGLLWAAATTAFLIVGVGTWRRIPDVGRVMCALGALTAVLMADDQFLLHEISIPWVLGLSEMVTFGAYAAVLVLVMLRFRDVILQLPEVSILAMALVAFGGSLTLDLFGWDVLERRIAEEGLKLLGTIAWAAFPIRIALRLLSGGDEMTRGPGSDVADRRTGRQ